MIENEWFKPGVIKVKLGVTIWRLEKNNFYSYAYNSTKLGILG